MLQPERTRRGLSLWQLAKGQEVPRQRTAPSRVYGGSTIAGGVVRRRPDKYGELKRDLAK